MGGFLKRTADALRRRLGGSRIAGAVAIWVVALGFLVWAAVSIIRIFQ